jgi:hypothetical protein
LAAPGLPGAAFAGVGPLLVALVATAFFVFAIVVDLGYGPYGECRKQSR